jgi:hypothetical protein
MMNPRHQLTIEDVASLAEVAGHVTQAELEGGWRQLARRLVREEHRGSAISLRATFPQSECVLAGRQLSKKCRSFS